MVYLFFEGSIYGGILFCSPTEQRWQSTGQTMEQLLCRKLRERKGEGKREREREGVCELENKKEREQRVKEERGRERERESLRMMS